jgi:hypothetical protein
MTSEDVFRPHKKKLLLSEIARAYTPWPMGTDAMVRILAWPDYTSDEQIQKVLQASCRLFDHDDACLCLRYDSRIDPPISQVVNNINIHLQKRPEVRELGQDINILIIDDEIPENEWYRVGLTAFCAIGFESSSDSTRGQFINVQRCEKIYV